MRGINTFLSHYNYRVDPELGSVVCVIRPIPCEFPACVDKLDKYWLPSISLSSQPRYAHVENVTITKYFNITIIG